MVNVDSAESLLARLDWYPFLTGVIVDHHGSPCLADTLFTAEREEKSAVSYLPMVIDAGPVHFRNRGQRQQDINLLLELPTAHSSAVL